MPEKQTDINHSLTKTELRVLPLICIYIFLSGCHSDNEEDRASRNGRQETLEFKDEEETVTTKSIQITQATETTTTTTRKRSGAGGSKALDLGAAAHYTGDRSPEGKVPTQTPFQASDISDCSFTKCLLYSYRPGNPLAAVWWPTC